MKKKIAIVVQRYGIEVNGGAELHGRLIAEKLKDIYDVEVLTSCAKDYKTWDNYYEHGETFVNGIKVTRFITLNSRNSSQLHKLSRKFRKRKLHQKLLRTFGLLEYMEKKFPSLDRITEQDEYDWAKNQGPYMPDLINFIADNYRYYDAMIFFTYLYFPTIYGLKVNPSKSILIPTAHDEPPIYFSLFKKLFSLPAFILFNTDMERKFVHKLFKNQFIRNDVVGVGIEKNVVSQSDVQKSRSLFNIGNDDKYFVYIGRIDKAKGCDELCYYYKKFIKDNSHLKIKLLLIGQVFMDIPPNENIILTGFIDDQTKNALLSDSLALIIPSQFESLSMVTLESMIDGIPVIANKNCEVLKSHIENSGSGFLYDNYDSFQSSLNEIINTSVEDLEIIRNKGVKYVEQYYSWSRVLTKLKRSIEVVAIS